MLLAFDMDDSLVNTRHTVLDRFRAVCGRLGMSLNQAETNRKMVELSSGNRTDDAFWREYAALKHFYPVSPIGDVKRTLSALTGYDLAIMTNSPRDSAMKKLEICGLEAKDFALIQTKDDIPYDHLKPDSRFFDAIRGSGFIYIGDSLSDLAAAGKDNFIGVCTGAVSRSEWASHLHYSRIMNDVHSLPERLKTLGIAGKPRREHA